MKLLTTLFALAVVPLSVLADGASITSAINAIDQETIKFNGTITAFRDLITALPIIVESGKLLKVLDEGTQTADESAPLSNDEALALVTPVTKLVDDVESTLNNALSKKKLFQKNGLTGIVKITLQKTKKAADDFSSAVIAKVPAELQSTAQQLIAPLDPAFDNAIQQFS